MAGESGLSSLLWGGVVPTDGSPVRVEVLIAEAARPEAIVLLDGDRAWTQAMLRAEMEDAAT
ncbi:MAG: hypothetical protein WKH64_18615 [Chloroflexia bacterium]